MHFKLKITALAVAASAAALVLAATPALASGPEAPTAITGPETAYGVVYGKAATIPIIPMGWRGQVATRGIFVPRGKPPKRGQNVTFRTWAGKLVTVVTTTPTTRQTFNLNTCYFTYTTDVTFSVVSNKSTRKFAGVSGPGAVEIYFAGYAPRLTFGPKKGQCNTNPNAPELAQGAVASALLSAVLRTP
jgi:hypothetical protein